jgi:hypothetical protein
LIVVVQLLAVLAGGSLIFILAWHRPVWVIFAVLATDALLDLLFQASIDRVNLGVNFNIDDAAFIVLLGTSFLLLLQYRKNIPRDAAPCLTLIVLVVLSFVRGVSTWGLKAAGNDTRNCLYFATPALAIMLLRPAFRLDAVRLARWVGWFGLCIGAVALLRWARLLPTPIELDDPLREVVRTLPSDYALLVGQAFIAAIYLQLVERRNAWWLAGAGILGALTFALQHRSVWVATAAGLAWLAVRTVRLSPVRWLGVGATAVVILGVIMVAAPMNLLESTRTMATINVQEVQNEDSTWAWRVEGYREATARLLASEPVVMLIGPPAGWDDTPSLEDSPSTNIHSRYIGVLAFYGLVGFTFLLLWFVMLAKRVGWPTRSRCGGSARDHTGKLFLEALFLSEMVYLVPYFGGPLQGAVLGMIWLAAKENGISIEACRVAFASYDFGGENRPATLQN